ncbi:MAG: RNA polymerase factor sigma-54 [Bacteroidetes bacterium]|jgi:RNA polymerase sigma-54 factor|nr:RNA polymerase factor sigma-54 [Bacteroidota bacterium]
MLRQGLRQKLLTRLSPQQIQFVKLLQVPTAMLEQRIKEELEDNPALEEADWTDDKPEDAYSDLDETGSDAPGDADEGENEAQEDLSEYIDDDDIANYRLADNNYSDDDDDRSIPIRVENSFHEDLVEQLRLLSLSETEQLIGQQIIGSLDNDGYLRRAVTSVADDLAFSHNLMVADEEVASMLRRIQQFDPAGIGARDLRECLLLQLERLPAQETVAHAQAILNRYFEEYTRKHYDKIARRLSLSDEHMKRAHQLILHLNPRPGNTKPSSDKTQQVIPDFIVTHEDSQLVVRLNARNAPELRVSSQYKDMFRDYEKSTKRDKNMREAVAFVKQKLDSARWFIDAIKQRQHTLLSSMEVIVALQDAFFRTGDFTQIRPMILKDVADRVGLDISTISRVASSKYVQTEYGTFLLKRFFSEGIMTDSGEEVSSIEVKEILSELIAGETKDSPLSDEKLSEILNERGYNIARRTIAKYREVMNIPVARMRKEL